MKESEKESQRWYLQAKDDFKFVDWVLKEGVFFDKGCFLAQQAGEKVVKACLYATGKSGIGTVSKKYGIETEEQK